MFTHTKWILLFELTTVFQVGENMAKSATKCSCSMCPGTMLIKCAKGKLFTTKSETELTASVLKKDPKHTRD